MLFMSKPIHYQLCNHCEIWDNIIISENMYTMCEMKYVKEQVTATCRKSLTQQVI